MRGDESCQGLHRVGGEQEPRQQGTLWCYPQVAGIFGHPMELFLAGGVRAKNEGHLVLGVGPVTQIFDDIGGGVVLRREIKKARWQVEREAVAKGENPESTFFVPRPLGSKAEALGQKVTADFWVHFGVESDGVHKPAALDTSSGENAAEASGEPQ